jgi:hypothetical protein
MKIQPKIRTQQEIENCVAGIAGTWVKRRNARKKLIDWSNELVNEEILICKGKVRDLRAMGAREQALRFWYAEITRLELKLL